MACEYGSGMCVFVRANALQGAIDVFQQAIDKRIKTIEDLDTSEKLASRKLDKLEEQYDLDTTPLCANCPHRR